MTQAKGDLLPRVITAAILVAVLVPVFGFGGPKGVAVVVALFASVGVWELCSQLSALKSGAGKAVTLAMGLLVTAGFFWCPPSAYLAIVVWVPLAVIAIHLFCYHQIQQTVDSAGQMIFALSYAVIPLGHAVLLARLDNGIAWVFMVLAAVCVADAGAYFVGKYVAGRFVGKHHITPSVSPKKTLEGLVGGIFAVPIGIATGLGLAAVTGTLSGRDLPSLGSFCQLWVVLVIADVVGDLAASAIKRRLGIKDFSDILRGHGGVLDRADALIFAIPATYHFLVITGNCVVK